MAVSNLNELESVMNELNAIQNELSSHDEKEAVLNNQISAMRAELTRLRDQRFAIKTKLSYTKKKKESLERTVALAFEAETLKRSLEEKMAEAEALIASAPWKNEAFDWQISGAVSLPDRALLGDKRGLGKTLSSLIWRKVHKTKRTLVCVRKEVASDFIKEIYIREPGLFVYNLISATPDTRKMAAILLKNIDEFIVITNIESWRRNVEGTIEDLLSIGFDGVILDEAHHIKNQGTGTAQGFFRLAEKIPKVLELTGTPIKNRPQEMYSLLHALYPKQFERESKFLFDYCMPVGQNKYVFSATGLKSLVAKINHFYLARTPEDIGRKVPPPRMIEYKLDMGAHPQQLEAYKMVAERALAVLNNGKAIPIVSQLAIMTRQAQMVSWPAGIVFNIKDDFTGEVIETVRFDVEQSVKMDWAEDLIQELTEEGERLIMFSRFKPAIYEMRRRLEKLGISVAVITGDEKGDRAEIFDDFDLKTSKEKPKYQVLLATYQTVGESANLNAARHMILYDRFWNPGNDDQATVHLPQVENTIDDYMAELINDKRSIVSDFKDAQEQQSKLIEHLRKTVS